MWVYISIPSFVVMLTNTLFNIVAQFLCKLLSGVSLPLCLLENEFLSSCGLLCSVMHEMPELGKVLCINFC